MDTLNQRDVAIDLRVVRAVDLAHPASAERSEDLVWAEASAGRDSTGHFLSAAVQLRTTVMGTIAASPVGVLMRNRFPSRLGT